MGVRNTAIDLAAGVIGGIVATEVNGYIQRALWDITPQREKAREPRTRDASSSGAAARKLLECVEDEPREAERQALKKGLHFGLGAAWGPLYCWLRRRTRLGPVGAGVTSGVALSLLVDESLNAVFRITPPPQAYPASAHIRGLLTHAAWGVVCAAVAEPLRTRFHRRLP